MTVTFLYKILLIVIVHGNNDLFSGWAFHSHVDVQLGFTITLDDFLDIVSSLSLERWEGFFNFQNFLYIADWFGSLGIRHP